MCVRELSGERSVMVDDVMAESTGDVCMIIYLFFYLDPNIFIAGTHALYHSVLIRCTHKPTPPLPGWNLQMLSRVR